MTATITQPIESGADASAQSVMDSKEGDVSQSSVSESSTDESAAQESAPAESSMGGSVARTGSSISADVETSDSAQQLDSALLSRIIEAALLAAQQPLSVVQLQSLFPEDAPVPSGAIGHALHDLRMACEDRGVELIEVASGFRYQVRSELQPWVARLWTERQVKYSRATLETLALIAYRQPITRGEIEQVRGVAVNSNLIKTLEEREWIRVVGHRDVPGKPELLGTTRTFLDYFGLKSLDALPPLAELHEIPELDPQLPFDSVPVPATVLDESDDDDLEEDDSDNHDSESMHADDAVDDALIMASSAHLDSDAIDSDSTELTSIDDDAASFKTERTDSDDSEPTSSQSDSSDPQEHIS